MITVGSLFTGIAGLDAGLHEALRETGASVRIAWMCEIDPFCQRVLRHHFPDVELHGDVQECSADNLCPVDILCGGFQCTDVSSAGRGAGLGPETRSGLTWLNMLRLIRELQPAAVLIENVASGARRWLGEVVRELRAADYFPYAVPLRAVDVGAPHLRKRIFLVALRGDGSEIRGRLEAERSGAGLAYGDGSRRSRIGRFGRRGPVDSLGAPPGSDADRRGRAGDRASNSAAALADVGFAGLEEQREQPARQEQPTAQRSGASGGRVGAGAASLRGVGAAPLRPHETGPASGGTLRGVGAAPLRPHETGPASGGTLRGVGAAPLRPHETGPASGGTLRGALRGRFCGCGWSFVGLSGDPCPRCGRRDGRGLDALVPDAQRGELRVESGRSGGPHGPDEGEPRDARADLGDACGARRQGPLGDGGADRIGRASLDSVGSDDAGGHERAAQPGLGLAADGLSRPLAHAAVAAPAPAPFEVALHRFPAGRGQAQHPWEESRALPASVKIPDRRAALHAVGNAVVPQCSLVAGRVLVHLALRQSEAT